MARDNAPPVNRKNISTQTELRVFLNIYQRPFRTLTSLFLLPDFSPPLALSIPDFLPSSNTHLPTFTCRFCLIRASEGRKRRVQTRQLPLYAVTFLFQLLDESM